MQPRTVQAVGERIIVQRFSAEQQTASGIVIPDHAQERPAEGRVVSVGSRIVGPVYTSDDNGNPTVKFFETPLRIKIGDHVIFGKWSGTDLKLEEGDTRDLVIMKEEEVLAVVPAVAE